MNEREWDDALIGRVLGGRYKIVRRIAAGGMGAVYAAVQASLQRDVAIKVIHPGLVDDKFRARFEQEAIATSRLKDPHVVTVHDFGIDGDVPYLVFEQLEGRDLAADLRASGAMPVRRAVRVLAGIASALVAAEQVGVVHRDLKPSNVFLLNTPTAVDHVKVIDFGIAKLLLPPSATAPGGRVVERPPAHGVHTEVGVVPGSPGYVAPERLTGGAGDHRADLYSLGVIAWEVLAGHAPFSGKDSVAMALAHLTQPVPSLSDAVTVPPRLDALITTLLAKSMHERPASAREVLRELEAIEATLALEASAPHMVVAASLAAAAGPEPASRHDAADTRNARAPAPDPHDSSMRSSANDSAFDALLARVASAPSALAPGTRWGRYVLEREIGRGGMGVVWRARDDKLGRDVALKVLPAALVGDDDRRARFQREGEAAAAIVHPCVATVLDVDEHGGVPFIAMELVEGESLRAALARGLVQERALAIARDVASGLARAHALGVVHRDLKPENVMVTTDGRAKLLDFGVARMLDPSVTDSGAPQLTREGMVLGTPAYMSPEQAEGRRVDARSDVFSFGAVLYEMLAGRPAFTGGSMAAILAAVLKDEPPADPALDGAVGGVVRCCLGKDTAGRYRDGEALAAALAAAVDVDAGTRSVAVARARHPMRKLVRVAALGASALAAVVLIVFAVSALRDADRVHRTGTQTVRRLTDAPGVERDPALSPDGSRLAFVATGAGGLDDIFVLDLAAEPSASRPVNVTASAVRSERTPAFSRDGQRLAFAVVNGASSEVWLVDVGAAGPGAPQKVVDDAASPSFTPNGLQLVYASEGFEEPEAVATRRRSAIRAVDLGAGTIRALLENGNCFAPKVSPNGARVAVWCIGGVDGAPDDGAGRRDVWTAPLSGDSDSGAARTVRVTDDDAIDYDPMWSSDGKSLTFLSDRSGAMSLWSVAINERTGEVDGAPTPSLAGATAMRDATCAGASVAYRTQSTSSVVERRPLDLAAERAGASSRVFETARVVRSVDPSPDGRWLVLETISQQSDVLLVSSDGKETRALTDDSAFDRGPRFLAAGTRIAFASTRAVDGDSAARYRIFTMAFDGSDLQPLAAGPCATAAPLPSPDGAFIAAAQLECGGRVALYDSTPRPPRQLALATRATWLPMAWQTPASLVVTALGGGWATVDVDSGRVVQHAREVGGVAALDTRRLLAFEGRALVVLDGDDARPLIDELGAALEVSTAFAEASFAVSADKQTLWLSTVRAESDLWLLTHQ